MSKPSITIFSILSLLLFLVTPVEARDIFVKINNQQAEINNQKVKLQIQGPRDTEKMRIARNDQDIEEQRWIKYQEEREFWLEDDYGQQEVRIQFKDEDGDVSREYYDTIFYKPSGAPEIKLNDGDEYTSNRTVEVEVIPPRDAVEMKIANRSDFEDTDWRWIDREFFWELEEEYGKQRVYIQFKEEDGGVSSLFKEDIYYRKQPDFKINDNDSETNNRLVQLQLTVPKGFNHIRISNSDNFSTSRKIKATSEVPWLLQADRGYKSVFVQFLSDNSSKVVEESIYFSDSHEIKSGTILTNPGYGWRLYYLGFDRKLHPFPSLSVYHSWFDDFSQVQTIESDKLSSFPIGRSICTKSSTWLVKMNSNQVYTPQPGCKLKPVRSPTAASLAFGNNWNKRVINLDISSIRTSPYFKESLSVADPNHGVYDKDKDGIPAKLEDNFSTSDQDEDTDNDGVTDFEEIKIFNSSPTKKDSNNNGSLDSEDIIAGRSPSVRSSQLQLNSSYFLPDSGLVQQHGLYYNHFGQLLKADQQSLNNNQLNPNFKLTPPYEFPISKEAPELQTSPYIKYPTIYKNGQLTFY
ncbi:MAG: hypothetical protein ABEJ02_01445 [Candidatus Paceibacteria bacterium]